jgi:hypothetical protein
VSAELARAPCAIGAVLSIAVKKLWEGSIAWLGRGALSRCVRRSETPTRVSVVVFDAESHIDRRYVVGATQESQLHRLGFTPKAQKAPGFSGAMRRRDGGLKSCANDEPPGRPRRPMRRALSRLRHVSSGASSIGPDVVVGHLPVRWYWDAAQARTWSFVRRG